MNNELFDGIIELIKSGAIIKTKITKETNLIEDLGYDSIRLIELYAGLENKYEVDIDFHYYTPDKFTVVEDIYEYFDNLIGVHNEK